MSWNLFFIRIAINRLFSSDKREEEKNSIEFRHEWKVFSSLHRGTFYANFLCFIKDYSNHKMTWSALNSIFVRKLLAMLLYGTFYDSKWMLKWWVRIIIIKILVLDFYLRYIYELLIMIRARCEGCIIQSHDNILYWNCLYDVAGKGTKK